MRLVLWAVVIAICQAQQGEQQVSFGDEGASLSITASSSVSASFGESCSRLFDLDGDGRSLEVAIGSPISNSQQGAVFLTFLAPDMTIVSQKEISVAADSFSAPALSSAARFGAAVSVADVNGDGHERELLVGAPSDRNALTQSTSQDGSVLVLFLSASGVVEDVRHLRSGENGVPADLIAWARFGSSLSAALSDVDGDGVARELVVGTQWNDGGCDGISCGGAYLLWLTDAGVVSKHVEWSNGKGGIPSGLLLAWDEFGSGVTAFFDANGDGVAAEVAISAPGDDTGQTDAGAVYVLVIGTLGRVSNRIKLANGQSGMPSVLGYSNKAGVGLSVGWVTPTRQALLLGTQAAGSGSGGTSGSSTSNDARGGFLVLGLQTGGSVASLQSFWPPQSTQPVAPSQGIGPGLTWLGDVSMSATPGAVAVAGPTSEPRWYAYRLEASSSGTTTTASDIAGSIVLGRMPFAASDSATSSALPSLSFEGAAYADPAAQNSAIVVVVADASAQDTLAASTATVLIDGVACGSTVRAPADVYGGRGFVCVSPPTAESSVALGSEAKVTVALVPSASGQGILANVTAKRLLRWGERWHGGNAPLGAPGGSWAATGVVSTMPSDSPGQRTFGASMAAIGDVDGDGTVDVAVGMPETAQGSATPLGEVQLLFLGSRGATVASSARLSPVDSGALSSVVPGDLFGAAVSPAGSWFGKAFPARTVAVGAPGTNSAQGKLFVVGVSTSGAVERVAEWSRSSSSSSSATAEEFGAAVMYGGESYSTSVLIVGMPGFDSNRGSIVVLQSGLQDGTMYESAIQASSSSDGGVSSLFADAKGRAGSALCLLGDVDNDGVAADIAVGAPGTSSGRGAVVLLRRSSVTSSYISEHRVITAGEGGFPQRTLSPSAAFGSALTWLGDLDNDGRPLEIAVAAPGMGSTTGQTSSGAVFVLFVNSTLHVRHYTRLAPGHSGLAVPASIAPADGVFGSSVAWLGSATQETATGAAPTRLLVGIANGGSDGRGAGVMLDLGYPFRAAAPPPACTTTAAFPAPQLFVRNGYSELYHDVYVVLHPRRPVSPITPIAGELTVSGASASWQYNDVWVPPQDSSGSWTYLGSRSRWTGDRLALVFRLPPGYGANHPAVLSVGSPMSPGRCSLSVGTVDYPAPIFSSLSIEAAPTPSRLPGAGGARIVIKGSLLLSLTAFPTSVQSVRLMVGPRECTSIQRSQDGTELTCTSTPPGAGGPHAVVLHLPGGQTSVVVSSSSTSSLTVRYEDPVVSAIVPSNVVPNPNVNRSFVVLGSGFGTASSDTTRLSIGGQECHAWTLINSSALRCDSVLAGGYTSTDVLIEQGVASAEATDLLVYEQPPKVVGATPAVIPTAGNVNVTLFGADLQAKQSSIVDVRIGTVQSCLWWGVISAFQIVCLAPPGAGRDLRVGVVVAGGVVGLSDVPLVSYNAPVVTAVTPASALSNPALAHNFTLTGSDFGPDAARLRSITVGGQPCTRQEWVSPTQVRCWEAFPPWKSRDVTVDVGGQTVTFADAFVFSPPPSISAVSPTTLKTEGGETVIISGQGFGSGNVTVTVGGSACTGGRAVSDSEVRCTSPPGVEAVTTVVVVTALNGAASASGLATRAAPQISSIRFADSAAAGTTTTTTSATASQQQEAYMLAGQSRVPLAGYRAARPLLLTLASAGSDTALVQIDVTLAAGAPEPTSLTCLGLAFAKTSGNGQLATANCTLDLSHVTQRTTASFVLRVGPRSSAPTTVEVVGAPVAAVLSVSSAPTTGIGNGSLAPVTLLGDSFGYDASDIASVTIGQRASPRVQWVSSTELRVAVPAGAGASQEVVVTSATGLQSAALQLSYARPLVTAIQPAFAFVDVRPSATASFDVFGENFGNGRADVTSVVVGGSQCRAIVWHSATKLGCVEAPSGDWLSGDVVVTIARQASLPNQLFEPIGTPVIDTVSPAVASPGDQILLLGSGFGYNETHPLNVSVGQSPCVNVVWRSNTAVSCVVTEQPASVLAAAASDPTLLSSLPVHITTAGGLTSKVSSAATIADATAGLSPVDLPSHVFAFRPVAQPTSISVRWTFPEDDPADQIAPVTGFIVTLQLAANPATSTATTLALTDVKSVVTKERVVVYRASLVAFDERPLIVTVAAINAAGTGPASLPGDPTPPNCAAGEMLLDLGPASTWSCVTCPAGAWCAGRSSANVTALPGYWRAPWSTLGFAACPRAKSCAGYNPSNASSTSSGGAVARLLQTSSGVAAAASGLPSLDEQLALDVVPRSTPDELVGKAALVETCEAGYEGTMCASCKPGWTSWGTFECRKCAPLPEVSLAMVGGLLLVVVVVSVLVVNAILVGTAPPETALTGTREESTVLADAVSVSSAGKAASRQGHRRGQRSSVMLDEAARHDGKVVPTFKIVVSHLQMVSLAASYSLQWPAEIIALFSAFSAVSSVSADVLSLDCALEAESGAQRLSVTRGSVFAAKSVLMWFLPILLVVVAACFWSSIWLTCGSGWRTCCRGLGCSFVKHVETARADARRRRSQLSGGAAVPREGGGSGGGGGAAELQPASTIEGGSGRFRGGRRSVVSSPSPASDAKDDDDKEEVTTASPRHAARADSEDGGTAAATHVLASSSVATPKSGEADRSIIPEPEPQSNCRRVWGIVTFDKHTLGVRLTWTDLLIVSSTVVLFLIHMTASISALEVLTCTTVTPESTVDASGQATSSNSSQLLPPGCDLPGVDPSIRMAGDLELCCQDPEVQLLSYGIGVTGVVLWALGIPLVAACLLYRSRNKLDEPRTRAVLGFLYYGYRRTGIGYLWESVTMLRKASIAAVTVFLAPLGVNAQTYAALLIVFALTVVQALYQPYASVQLNRLELASLVCAFVTFDAGLYLSDANTGARGQVGATIIILLVNIGFFLYVARILSRIAHKQFCQGREK